MMEVHPYPVATDPELAPVQASLPTSPELTNDILREMHAHPDKFPGNERPKPADVIESRPFTYTEHQVPGHLPEDPPVLLAVFTPTAKAAGPRSCIYYGHPGGVVLGNCFTAVAPVLDWALANDSVLVSVDFRLPPEHPAPAPVNDCYAGLVWLCKEGPAALGIDSARVVTAGLSGGAAVMAGMHHMAVDLGGPRVRGQVLFSPMLDDRVNTVSSRQFNSLPMWTRKTNIGAWHAYVGHLGGDVSHYYSPARATVEQMRGLPSTFIDVGSADLYRDEAVNYASRMWEAGGDCSLHVWAGGFHGSELVVPQAHVSVQSWHTKGEWLKKMLAPIEGK